MITVAELIEKLQKFDQDFFVVVPGYETGLDDITTVIAINVIRDVYAEEQRFLGEHEEGISHEPNAVFIKGRHG